LPGFASGYCSSKRLIGKLTGCGAVLVASAPPLLGFDRPIQPSQAMG